MGSELEELRASAFGPRTPLSEKLLGIAIRAQNFTGSSGVAVALTEGEEMVCRANWGTSAPEIGARLSIEHSFTGMCVRTGSPVRCDDTEIDPRVDREACQALGIRALVAAPVRLGPKAILGVIAAFSDSPHAFSDKHLFIVTTLSETIAELLQDEDRIQPLVRELESAAEPWRAAAVAQAPITMPEDRAIVTIKGEDADFTARADVEEQYAPKAPSQAEPRVAPGPQPSAAEVATTSGAAAGESSLRQEGASARLAFVQPTPAVASDIGAAWTLTFGALKASSNSRRRLFVGALLIIFALLVVAGWRTRKGPRRQVPAVSRPELLQAPRPQTEQAQGLVPAQLIQRVEPIYPAKARRLSISGSVTLKATITNTGTVADVLWVKGNDVFRDSAITAVKQWHYEPATLNGQAVQSEAEIVLLFALL